MMETEGMVVFVVTTKSLLRFPLGDNYTCLGRCQRQANGEGAARPRLAANAYFTTMRPHNLFDNGQAQAGPVFPTSGAGRIGLIEPVEDVRQGLGRNSRAGICPLYLNSGASCAA